MEFERQPWEKDPDPWEGGHPPLQEDDSDYDPDELEGVEAGEALAQMLLSMVWARKMSAKTACVIAWWASRAGALGPVKDLAFRPNAPTGLFSRKIDSVSGIDLKKIIPGICPVFRGTLDTITPVRSSIFR